MNEGPPDGPDGDEFGDYDLEPLDEHELRHVEQDLADLTEFEAAFRPEGYRGVAVWCQDCAEEHLYPWDMLRENLTTLLETGETPVHEPAFAPDPSRYIPWDYARGYVDALRDVGAHEKAELDQCGRCNLELEGLGDANFCPRCGANLVADRLRMALEEAGLDRDAVAATMRRAGFATR